MRVRELIEALSEYPEDMEVIMSSDGEGNKYRLVCSYESSWANVDRGPYGVEDVEVHNNEPCPPDCGPCETDDDHDHVPEDAVKVVILWPTY